MRPVDKIMVTRDPNMPLTRRCTIGGRTDGTNGVGGERVGNGGGQGSINLWCDEDIVSDNWQWKIGSWVSRISCRNRTKIEFCLASHFYISSENRIAIAKITKYGRKNISNFKLSIQSSRFIYPTVHSYGRKECKENITHVMVADAKNM
jgi:hypothetical protein